MGCKIMLILFVFFGIIVIVFIFFTVKTTIGLLEDQSNDKKAAQAEKVRFEKLPVIKAIVLDGDSIITPFSKNKVNVCFMNFGLTNSYRKNLRWRNSTARNYVTTYSNFSTIYSRPQLNLLINGKKYVLKSKKIILTDVVFDTLEKKKSGMWMEEFSTNPKYDELLFLNNYDFYKKYSKTTKEEEDAYLGRVKIFCSFRDLSDYINCYYLTRLVKKDIPEKCNYAIEYSYHLREYVYNVGDTISFKGKIVNNEIIPLQ